MGTEARMVLYATSQGDADSAARAAFARIASLDATLSDHRRESELLTVGLRSVRVPVRVSDDLLVVLRAALELSAETNGAFDVTIGALTALRRDSAMWRGRGAHAEYESARCNALRAVGWKNVVLDTAARTVTFKERDMRLDLGGIAKGYAADEALKVLRAHGVERALVSIGGDLVVGRAPPGDAGWRVTVEDADSAHASMILENAALSTSGDSEQHVDSAGVRYSHVIDPRTGLPLTSRLAATVLAPTGMEADGWSTAVTVLDSAQRARFIAAHPQGTFYVRAASTGPAPARALPPPCSGVGIAR